MADFPQKDISRIRNFCIIAHIDHGKSTLADRILEKTQAISLRKMEDQLLDNMELERERGITIKARAVKVEYTAKDGNLYEFNLIDTPGHVDFNYEVSRSLAACEGALLVVDASQGIEAQTLANTYLAIEHDLEVVPVVNKIDLPSANPDMVCHEIEDIIGIPALDAPRISAKTGLNVEEVLERIVTDIPAPQGDPDAPLQALIFDSYYDSYKGVIVYIRVMQGTVRPGDDILMMATGARFKVVEAGYMGATNLVPTSGLCAGEVGYITASIKSVKDTVVGDTVTNAAAPAKEALPGYRQVNPMVFCGIYPADGAKYPDLRDALEKLQLNDASLSFEPETSKALGFGFRCGFLGLLHMEVIQERLEREFNLDLVTTAPSVIYKLNMTDGTTMMIDNPTNYPDPSDIESAEEPYVKASIFSPTTYIGTIMELCQERRGTYKDTKYLDTDRVELHYELPLNEIVYDFFDALKARTKGYASLDYEFIDYCPNLTQITVAENNPVYRSEGNCIIEKATGTVVKGCNTSVIPQGIKAIGPCAFKWFQAEEIVIPHGVEIIYEEAFLESTVKKVVLPDTLTEIRGAAFRKCENITEIAFPASIKRIGACAFIYCQHLPTLYIPEDTEIGWEAFWWGTKIVRVPSQAAS